MCIRDSLKTFYTQCVSYNRVCYLKDVVKSWPAFSKWPYESDGYRYIAGLLGSMETSVFIDEDATSSSEDFSSFSFKPETSVVKSFSPDFLQGMSEKALGMVMRDSTEQLQSKLANDIIYPEFYN